MLEATIAILGEVSDEVWGVSDGSRDWPALPGADAPAPGARRAAYRGFSPHVRVRYLEEWDRFDPDGRPFCNINTDEDETEVRMILNRS